MITSTAVLKEEKKYQERQGLIQNLRLYLNQRILGQEYLVDRLLIALLADGHLLVEGAPGLAKTRAIKELAQCIEGDFHRIQFTPDLLPADITGTEIYRPQDNSFHFQRGPLFHNLILADEINRSPAKVQSALLEAMAERQITIGRLSYELPPLFLVMATQNPIEQEGTYPLPEAQLDRFLMYIHIGYPDTAAETRILQLARYEANAEEISVQPNTRPHLMQADIFAARKEILGLHMADALEQYLIQLIMATRYPGKLDAQLAQWIRYGASPRATISLDRCARAHAWLEGRDFVSPEDIYKMAPDILRHRILLSFEAEADGINTNEVINRILHLIAIP